MEIALGTNPNDADSDDDTYTDGHEYSTGANPLDPQELPEGSASSPTDLFADTTNDSDGDGLTDGEETHIQAPTLALQIPITTESQTTKSSS